MSKVAITGGSGFVGTNLIAYLNEIDTKVQLLSRNDLENISASLLEKTVQSIIHLAGKAHDLKKTANPEIYYDVNFELTKKLFDAFLKSDAEKFIFVSSVKAVADSYQGFLTEDVVPDPKTDYGKSKLMAENYIMSHSLPANKSYYILRPCMIHGPGNKGNLNLLYQFCKKGIPYPLASFKNKRSFLSVYNLCFVIDYIINHNIPSGIYNVADNEALSTNKVIEILAHSMNRKPLFWNISPNVIKILAKVGDVLHLPLTTDRLTKLTESYKVSNNKIVNVMGAVLPINTVDGLKITAESFKSF